MAFFLTASFAFGQSSPHFVKTILFGSDGKPTGGIQGFERATMWLLKRAPDYWVKVESFYCASDVTSKEEDTQEKLLQKALQKGQLVKQELESRTIDTDKIEVVALGKSEPFTKCQVRIIAGPGKTRPVATQAK